MNDLCVDGDHCLLDLLCRNRRREPDKSAVMVVSNHPDLAAQTRSFGVPFMHVPATKDTRVQAEQHQLHALRATLEVSVDAVR